MKSLQLINALTLLPRLMNGKYLVSYFYRNKFCESAPATVISVNWTDTIQDDLPVYGLLFENIPFTDYCGTAPAALQDYCCQSFLEGSEFDKIVPRYHSTVTFALDTIPIVPTNEDKSNSYCSLHSENIAELHGFSDIKVLNDSECAESYFKCIGNQDHGSVQIYPQKDCLGSPKAFNLTGSWSSLNDTTIPTVIGTYGHIESHLKTNWITYIPSELAISKFEYAWEIASGAIIITAFTVAVLLTGFWIYLYYKSSLENKLIFIFTPVVLVLEQCFSFYYYYTKFESYYLLMVFYTVRNYFRYIASLASIMATIFLLKRVVDPPSLATYSAIFVVLVHIVCVGGRYETYSLFYGGASTFLKTWRSLVVYWTIFRFLWNVLPVLIIAYQITHFAGDSFIRRKRAIESYDRFFFPLVYSQCAIAFGYLACYHLTNSTNTLGDDRNYWALSVFGLFCQQANSFTNLVLIERLKMILRKSRGKPKVYHKNQRDSRTATKTVTASTEKPRNSRASSQQ